MAMCRRPGITVDETGDGPGLDPRLAHLLGRHRARGCAAQVGDHLVLEGEADQFDAFCAKHLVERTQQGRLAGTRDTLDVEEAILARQYGDARGELSGIELPAIAPGPLDPEFASGLLKPGHGEVGRHEYPAFADPGLDPVQYLLLSAKRRRRGHEIVVPIEPVRLARNEVALADKLADALDHSAAFEPLDLEAERGAQDRLGAESCLALREMPDRRRGGMLCLDRGSAEQKRSRTARGQFARWPQGRTDPDRHFGKGRARCFAQGGACLFLGPLTRFGDKRLAGEPQRLGPVLPIAGQRFPVGHREFGIARVDRDPVEPFGGRYAGFFGLGEDVLAALAERLDDLCGHALDFESAVLARSLGLVAELLQLGAECGVVELADGRVVLPDLAVPQRLPVAFEVAGEVGDDGMDMPLRIERAARVVGEQGIDQVAGLLRLTIAIAFVVARLSELLFDELRHGRSDSRHMGLKDARVPADERQDRR